MAAAAPATPNTLAPAATAPPTPAPARSSRAASCPDENSFARGNYSKTKTVIVVA